MNKIHEGRFKVAFSDLWYLAAYFVLMEPRYFFYVSGIKELFKIAVLAITAYLFLDYFAIRRKRSKTTLLIVVYHLYLIAITVIKRGDISTAVFDSCMFCGLSILTELVLKRRPQFLFRQLPMLLATEVVINWGTMVLYPGGLYSTTYFANNYFLGYDNQMINIFIPALLFAYLGLLYNKKRNTVRFLFLAVLIAASIVQIWSGASLVLIAMILGGVFSGIINRTRIFNMLNYFLVNISCFVVIVLLRLQEYFEYFIVVILGKNLTFTGRTYIWDNVISFIKLNPVWGYGIENQAYRSSKMSIARASTKAFSGLHSHDRFLETTYRGGLILLIIYLLILIIAVYYLTKYKERTCSKILALFVFAYLTGMLTEFYRLSYMFFPFLVLSENVDVLDSFLMENAKGG